MARGRPRVSAAVVAQDEERHIGGCLRSVVWADETIVLDGSSQDRTPALARGAGAAVYARPFDDFASQRQALIELCRGDWILFVDADERVSRGLAAEVREVIGRSDPDAPVAYWVPRRNYIWGRWIHGGGWLPDPQLRLIRRDRARYDPARPVHELVQIDGVTATLRCHLVHYNYDDITEFVRKQHRYAALEARALCVDGSTPDARRLLSAPAREFWRRYVQLGGRRDGWRGLGLALLTGLAVADTQLQLRRAGARSTAR